MAINRKLLLVSSLAVVVSACTNATESGVSIDVSSYSMPREAQAEIPAEEIARIVVYKQVLFLPSISDAIINPNLTLDGEPIGKCRFGQPIEVTITPGEYVLESDSEFPNGKKFTIEAGETAYVQCKLGAGFLVPNTILEFVDEETGLRDVTRIESRGQQG